MAFLHAVIVAAHPPSSNLAAFCVNIISHVKTVRNRRPTSISNVGQHQRGITDSTSELPLVTQPSGLFVSCHSLAAGSTGTPGQAQPQATSRAPAAKRERRAPSPHALVTPQEMAIADGADPSLEMTSDDSPGKVGSELGQPILSTLGDEVVLRSGIPALAPRPRTGKGRRTSVGSRGLKVKRVASPAPRSSPVLVHRLVQECRAERAQDLEARMRTLEPQRETEHAWLP